MSVGWLLAGAATRDTTCCKVLRAPLNEFFRAAAGLAGEPPAVLATEAMHVLTMLPSPSSSQRAARNSCTKSAPTLDPCTASTMASTDSYMQASCTV
eukprot:CAMPEP_0204015864 /NCGR_PEP_ID=MMETSP0360-20130528/26353_1 /ASSEMBLY_ACC=CAM_ASM_000342 /TAXON_ID=268821 /ORGANISM="Scrippsiella Hangoei, Strain SHTV-5" /LENGTH=96 /DNA_ID=CAMNT_0050958815 /DNA_START=35 /DNA_END=325 /DNA_ORIENTATION=+